MGMPDRINIGSAMGPRLGIHVDLDLHRTRSGYWDFLGRGRAMGGASSVDQIR